MAHASEKKILVVDDEPDVRNFLVACIKDAGFKVDFAVDGVEALEKIKEDTPDLITLDMVMPRKSGINLIRKLRKNENWADIPIVIITAHANDKIGEEGIKEFNALATRHRPKITMEKPVTPKRLVKAICDILTVEPDEENQKTEFSDEQEEIIKFVQSTDLKTLKRIHDALNK